MGWSFRIGRLAGIDVYVHFTFLFLLGWIAVSGYLATGNAIVAAAGVVLTGVVFFIIVLHELGHALAARYYGIPTRDITLLPIGGVARLERMPEKPSQELVVALAGPAVNVVLAALLFPFIPSHDLADPAQSLSVTSSVIEGLAEQLFRINVWLVIFNLLPAFPMDGGRVLRALMAMRLGPVRATRLAARVGQGMAILFAVIGLIGIPGVLEANPFLFIVALFVWFGARAELNAFERRAGLAGVPVAAVMLREFSAVDPDDTLGSVVRFARQGLQKDFPVAVGGRLVGLLSRQDLTRGLTGFGPDGRVLQAMRRDFPTLNPDEPAERALALMAEGDPVLPVLYFGRLVGLVTAENMSEFLWYQRTHPGIPGASAEDIRARSGV